jgi:hypothetical protein
MIFSFCLFLPCSVPQSLNLRQKTDPALTGSIPEEDDDDDDNWSGKIFSIRKNN